jgi:hypothetical protein
VYLIALMRQARRRNKGTVRNRRRQAGKLILDQVRKRRPVKFAKLTYNDRNIRRSEIFTKALACFVEQIWADAVGGRNGGSAI